MHSQGIRPFGPLSGEVDHPAGASPRKCYLFIFLANHHRSDSWQVYPDMPGMNKWEYQSGVEGMSAPTQAKSWTGPK
jgi:hypothetical protein